MSYHIKWRNKYVKVMELKNKIIRPHGNILGTDVSNLFGTYVSFSP